MGWRTGRAAGALAVDERREILWLLGHLEWVVPCLMCQKHIVDYRKKNPPQDTTEALGVWIWKFHEAVNERLGKPTGPPFTRDLGKTDGVARLWKEYMVLVRHALVKGVGAMTSVSVKEWARHFALWQAIA